MEKLAGSMFCIRRTAMRNQRDGNSKNGRNKRRGNEKV